MGRYLTREYAIANDVFDPTPWDEDDPDVLQYNHNPVVCPLCGREIRLDENVVHFTVEGRRKYCHESCMDKKFPGFDDFFDAVGMDYTMDSGAWFAERM